MAIWKLIEGYKTPYRINQKGQVERQRKDGSWVRLAQVPDTKGYLRVCFRTVDGTQQRRMISTLLYEYFGPDVKGANHPSGRRVEMIDRYGKVVKVYPSLTEAAKENHLALGSVEYRCKGRMKYPFEHGQYSFRYKE